jgi:hypothetical protein
MPLRAHLGQIQQMDVESEEFHKVPQTDRGNGPLVTSKGRPGTGTRETNVGKIGGVAWDYK